MAAIGIIIGLLLAFVWAESKHIKYHHPRHKRFDTLNKYWYYLLH